MPAFDYGISYPQTLSLPCITKVVQIVRAGEIVERKDELGMAAASVQLYLQRVTLGVPADAEEGVFAAAPEVEAATIDELETACRSAVEQLEDDPNGRAANVKAFDPATLAMILELVMQLINLWRNRS